VPLLVAEILVGTPVRSEWVMAWIPVVAGLALRAWGVGHLGSRSRTRKADAWELVRSGPFAWVRNPLYLGNGLMWLGVGWACGPAWLAAWVVFLALHYPLVVAWEEQHLRHALGQAYDQYLEEVPRWLPRGRKEVSSHPWSIAEVVSGERSTWLAAAVVMGILFLRS
jgi:protein-S-isoprenylcysteine O-methyltransferase Ste14